MCPAGCEVCPTCTSNHRAVPWSARLGLGLGLESGLGLGLRFELGLELGLGLGVPRRVRAQPH